MSNDNNVTAAARLTAFEAGKRRTVADIRIVYIDGETPEAVVYRGRVFVLDKPPEKPVEDIAFYYREALTCWPACYTGLGQG